MLSSPKPGFYLYNWPKPSACIREPVRGTLLLSEHVTISVKSSGLYFKSYDFLPFAAYGFCKNTRICCKRKKIVWFEVHTWRFYADCDMFWEKPCPAYRLPDTGRGFRSVVQIETRAFSLRFCSRLSAFCTVPQCSRLIALHIDVAVITVNQ